MAIQIVGEVLEGALSVTPTEKLVLVALANNANSDTRVTWCKVETLARGANIARRQVIRVVDSLEEQGFIRVYHSLGKKRYHLYRITKLGDRAEQESDIPIRLDMDGRTYYWRHAGPGIEARAGCAPHKDLYPPVERVLAEDQRHVVRIQRVPGKKVFQK